MKTSAILDRLELELVNELKKHNAAAEQLLRSSDRIKQLKADLLKAYLAVFAPGT